MRVRAPSIAVVFLSVLAGSAPAFGAGLGDTCDGIAALRCEKGLWCEHPPGECQVADGAGACVKEPGPVCTKVYLPVCGCDGKTYGNDCERRAAKVQFDHIGECDK